MEAPEARRSRSPSKRSKSKSRSRSPSKSRSRSRQRFDNKVTMFLIVSCPFLDQARQMRVNSPRRKMYLLYLSFFSESECRTSAIVGARKKSVIMEIGWAFTLTCLVLILYFFIYLFIYLLSCFIKCYLLFTFIYFWIYWFVNYY